MRIHVQECDYPHGHSEYAISCCKSYGYERGEFIEQSGAVFCSRNETLSEIGNQIEKVMEIELWKGNQINRKIVSEMSR